VPPRNGLERLLNLYRLVEQTRSLELRIAASAVVEVALAESGEQEIRVGHRESRTEALLVGDAVGRMIADCGCEASKLRLGILTQMLAQREETRDAAERLHDQSRLMKERIERVAERKRMAIAYEEDRRTQADSDDRYASRLGWNSAQDRQAAVLPER
jgi:hypothetical protein